MVGLALGVILGTHVQYQHKEFNEVVGESVSKILLEVVQVKNNL